MNQVRDVTEKYPNEAVLTASAQTTVYRSTDQRTGDPVVVKLVTSIGQAETQVQRNRFLRVMGAVQILKLKGFPRLIDFGIADEGTAFLVMEPVEGEPLSKCVGSPPDRMLGLLAQVADTLEALARGGVCHHNLNPQNILVVRGAKGEEVRLLGLGTAAYLEQVVSSAIPEEAAEADRYTAPERFKHDAEGAAEDWRSDLFSLALIASEMLEADIEGLGGADPSITLPQPARALLVDAEKLASTLEIALRADPRQRQIGWAELHDALRSRAPEPPDFGATVAIPIDRLPIPSPTALEEGLTGDGDTGETGEPPVAIDDGYATNQGADLTVPAPGVLTDDIDPHGETLTSIGITDSAHGTLTLKADGSFTYAPEPGFFGTDSFTYKANNGELDSNVATVTITVKEVKEPPMAVGDEFVMDQDVALDLPAPGVLANDTDPHGETLTAIGITDPAHGTLTLKADGSFTYAPEPGFFGTDSFTYKANNGELDSNHATVTITVNEVKKPPMVENDEYATDQDIALTVPAPGVLANDTGADGEALTAIVVTDPVNGTVTLKADGSFTYAPEPGFFGADSFTYKANDGALDSNVATVTITVVKVEAPPDWEGDSVLGSGSETVQVALPGGLPGYPEPPAVPEDVPTEEPTTTPPEPESEGSGDDPKLDTPQIIPPPLPEPAPVPVPPPLPQELSPRPPHLPRRNIAILTGAAAILAVIVLVVLWAKSTGEAPVSPPTATAVPPPIPTRAPVPTEVPLPALHPGLEYAQNALIDGDPEAARGELSALTEEEIEAFTEDEQALYDELTAALEGGRRDQSIKDLRGGLSWSSVKMLRRAVAGLSGLEDDEIAAVPGLAGDLERAREALRLHTLMYRARDNGDNVQLLERASAMIEVLPDYSIAIAWREEAAVSLEAEAEAAAQSGQFERALAAIEPISRFWPEREGTEDRIARYRRLQEEHRRLREDESNYEGVLAAAAERGEAGAPDEGLRLLTNRRAPDSLAQRQRELVARLAAQLAELDASPPQVELAPGSELVYRKNHPVTITFRITDDYRVVDTVLMVRAQGSSEYGELPLSGPDGDRYSLEIGPELHQNQNLEIYFEALDVSGHVGRLGSPSEPLLLKRKGLLKKILGK